MFWNFIGACILWDAMTLLQKGAKEVRAKKRRKLRGEQPSTPTPPPPCPEDLPAVAPILLDDEELFLCATVAPDNPVSELR